MKILAIESSCDETSASVLEIEQNNFYVKSNVVSSQVNIHAKYGGVVPEVAARCHAENIMPVILESLKNLKNPQKEIDAIAVTNGPGLITSLRVGVEAAKTLAYAWKKPLISVNHVIGHIYANWLSPAEEIRNPKQPPHSPPISPRAKQGELEGVKFPALCLVVSGGHTMLVLMKGRGKFKVVGQTLDDAAGECFDKAAKILGLGYPGGPAIAACAANSKFQNPNSKIELPRPMINSNDFNFSFSGLKTAVLYKVMKSDVARGLVPRKKNGTQDAALQNFITEMATETQNAIVDVLVSKTIRAAKKYNVKTVMLGGGVAANQELRKRIEKTVKKELPNTLYLIPGTSLCTDNAAMIAVAAYFNPKYVSWNKMEPDPNLGL